MKEFSKQYFDILNNELKGLNLTAINDFEEFHVKQIIDSILPLENSANFRKDIEDKKILVDVGFGGGFPILPLAKLLPDIQFIGFEARNKKVEAVRLLADLLGLKNVKVYHERLENILFDREVVITNKAVSTVEKFLSLINTNKSLEIYFYKAKNFFELEGEFIKSLKSDKILENSEMDLTGGNKRYLFGVKVENVPRRTTKNLVKFTSFL